MTATDKALSPAAPLDAAPAPREDRARAYGVVGKIVSRFSLLMSARVAGALIGLVTQIVLARLLGAEQLGQFYIALSLAAVLAILCGLGFPSIIVSFITRYRTARDWTALKAFVGSARRQTALTTGLALAGLGGLVAATSILPDALVLPLLLGLATTPFFVMLRVNASIANAYRRFSLAYLPDLLGRPMLLLAAVSLIFLLGTPMTVGAVLAFHLGIAALLAIAQHVRVAAALRGDLQANTGTDDSLKAPSEQTARWRKHALPMVVVALFTALFADLNILLAGLFLPVDQTAILSVCLKLALLMGFATNLVRQVVLPDAGDAYARGKRHKVAVLFHRANALSIIVCAAGTIVFVVAGAHLLGLFGDAFVAGYWALVVLGLGEICRAFAGPASQMLTLAGAERAAIPVFALGLAVLVALHVTLTPMFGVMGAAVAVLLTTLYWTAYLTAVAARKTGVRVAGFASLLAR